MSLRRMRQRNRKEECFVKEEYVKALHMKYEDWLINGKFPIPCPVIVINGNEDAKYVLDETVEKIRSL